MIYCHFSLYGRTILFIRSHGINNLPMSAMTYYINTLDNQSSGAGAGQHTLNVGDIFHKTIKLTFKKFNQMDFQN